VGWVGLGCVVLCCLVLCCLVLFGFVLFAVVLCFAGRTVVPNRVFLYTNMHFFLNKFLK